MEPIVGIDVDQRAFRNTLSHFASGIAVITGVDTGEPIGFTCQSFYSVSLQPPLVSFSVMTTSTSYPRIRDSGRFAVNVLAHDQQDLALQFARSGTDKWAGVDWAPTCTGNPVIANTEMWLDCDIWAEHEAGDHLIVIGHVREMCADGWAKHHPLLMFTGKFHHLRELGDTPESLRTR
ncbi:flavin reductase family protein [Nocardia pseudovaccinii]|uniref:flavin reductase family protein n=1 Tax=Nocardia pseudovaccinii TaxID=189540 RepID=UPI003D9496AA